MSTHRHQSTSCPQCGYKLDASTNISGGEGAPVGGDFTLCIECGAICRYAPSLNLFKASKADLVELLEADPKGFTALLRARMGIAHLKNASRKRRAQWN